MDKDIITGCILIVGALFSVTVLTLWSRRIIRRIAQTGYRTGRQTLKDLTGADNQQTSTSNAPARELSLFHIAMMGLGMMIGAGVFLSMGISIGTAGAGGAYNTEIGNLKQYS